MLSEEKLLNLIEPLLKERGMELVDFEFSRVGKRLLLRFFIDRIEGGITIDELAEVNQELGTLLDLSAEISESYLLEVSSPGVYRRIRKLKDFLKYINYKLEVTTKEKLEGRRNFSGVLLGADSLGITLMVDGKSILIPLGLIQRANLKEEL